VTKNRLTDPSENRALEFKGEFPRFENSLVSATIGINWSICGDVRQNPRIAFIEKRPSALATMINWMKFRPVRLGCDHWSVLLASRQFATTEVQHGDGVSRAVASRDCRAAKDLVWV
jgi:hypothetical protein